jgi:uncharacterized protein with von Willebrand factor type A (vWA) domain
VVLVAGVEAVVVVVDLVDRVAQVAQDVMVHGAVAVVVATVHRRGARDNSAVKTLFSNLEPIWLEVN